MSAELWVCANCDTVGPLSKHGECLACSSTAVMPIASLPTEPAVKPKKKRVSKKQRDISVLERLMK